jgi:DNA-directed RNA polymerase specialized sigma24 family protein
MRDIALELCNWKKRLESPERPWDPNVLREARNGSRPAKLLILRRYEHRVARIIESRLGNAQIRDKEDILQDALATIYTKLEAKGFEWESENAFFRWLVLTVTAEIKSELTLQAQEREAVVHFYWSEPEALEYFLGPQDSQETVGLDDVSYIRSKLNKLDITDRKIVAMISGGASFGLVSQKLGISVLRVRRRYQISLEQLRRELAELE